ncbi:tetratricopeptide repeat protein [Chitinibacter sp. SCUT-21]|uniref:tetratricopeptide repeat protein n=1 Tax=Chitinibacter sp. SCUT-21 TaxID=2970891 RepID=UPI0035A5ED2E
MPEQQTARQQQLQEIENGLFTEPVVARSRCVALLDEARQGSDFQIFIQAALLFSKIEDQLADLPTALKTLEEALVYAQEFHWAEFEAAIFEQMGCCHYSLAQYDLALQDWRECILLCGHAAATYTRALAFIGLGRLCDLAEQYQQAVAMHQHAHKLLLPSEDFYAITMAMINWAVNLQRLQRWDDAAELLQQALALSEHHQLPHHAAECHLRLAQVAIAQARWLEAEHCLEEGLSVVAQTPYHWVEANLLFEWAQLLQNQQALEQALDVLKRGLLLTQEDGFKTMELAFLRQAETLCLALGWHLQASEFERQANFLHFDSVDTHSLAQRLHLQELDALLR